MIRRLGCCLLLCTALSCAVFKDRLPPKREFRGVWIATVANIDWPGSGTDPWTVQQRDFRALLDFYREHNFNAVIVQVRTAGDAFYPSKFAPISRFLTGKEGEMGDLDRDPLAWMIDATHKRGFEFHAWVNPYRDTFDQQTAVLAPEHDFFQHPDWMVSYGKKFYYNPGLPAVREHIVEVISELVARYDLDGIHFDDYFYPYQIQGEKFADSVAYTTYRDPDQSLEDWRRGNINALVRETHQTIKALKPWVQFGISPFGVWRNRSSDPLGSDTRAGQTNFDHLFADPLEWSREGWVDYLAPQLYWSMDYPPASHRKLMDWWASAVPQTPLFIGNGAYKVRNNADDAWEARQELPEQLVLARKTKNVRGNIFFSAGSLMKSNRDIARYLRKNVYAYPASLPPVVHEGKNPPAKPRLNMKEGRDYLYFTILDKSLRFQFAEIKGLGRKEQGGKKRKQNQAKRIYLGELSTFRVPTKSLQGKKRMEIVFIDRYRQKTKPLRLVRN